MPAWHHKHSAKRNGETDTKKTERHLGLQEFCDVIMGSEAKEMLGTCRENEYTARALSLDLPESCKVYKFHGVKVSVKFFHRAVLGKRLDSRATMGLGGGVGGGVADRCSVGVKINDT